MYSAAAPVGSPFVKKYKSREMGYSPVAMVPSDGATPVDAHGAHARLSVLGLDEAHGNIADGTAGTTHDIAHLAVPESTAARRSKAEPSMTIDLNASRVPEASSRLTS